MKRSLTLSCLTLTILACTTQTASACLPWLDPFAWFGLYGCGYQPQCCNFGCAPAVNPYPVYRPQMLPAYPAPVPVSNAGCDCNGTAMAPVQQFQAVQVPVTSYRAVTQYVPQTSYQTRYQYAQQLAAGYPVQAYHQPLPQQAMQTYPHTNVAIAPSVTYPPSNSGGSFSAGTTIQGTYPSAGIQPAPVFPAPVIHESPNVASPIPAGDIHGDHEFPTQSSYQPMLHAPTAAVPTALPTPPIRRVSYGVTPQKAARYRSSVR
jgi:hypothetical protein